MKLAWQIEAFFLNRPARDFRMAEVLAGIYPENCTLKQRSAIRRQAHHVVQAFAVAGFLLIRPSSQRRGGYSTYRMKV